MSKKRKNKKQGFHRTNLKRMLDQMHEVYPEDATKKELKRIYRYSPNKHLIGLGDRSSYSGEGNDIFDRRRRVPGNMFRG